MKLYRRIVSMFVAALVILSASMLAPYAAPFARAKAASGETLTIRGDGVGQELVFSREDLEKMNSEQHIYSVANNFPTARADYDAGVPLMTLLEQAGLKDSAQQLTFISSDGYQRTFTIDELFAPRYYFADKGDGTAVPAMICLQSSTTGFDSLEPIDMRLVMGQRSRGEQNNPWFVRYLSVIEVSAAQPAKWSPVTFDRTAGESGVTLAMQHTDFDSVKIYYTTDGSLPTVNSAMYNISASYYQPQLNKPLLISKTTTVRAIAIGAGKLDSDIASITVSFDNAMFTDLGGYDWAKSAIESLAAKGIVNGVGDGRFDPGGMLTRAAFATMLGRGYGDGVPASGAAETQGSAAGAGQFSDVAPGSWYGGHVLWAAGMGIILGFEDGTFRPDDALTVEQMIAIAVRAGGFAIEPPGGADAAPGVDLSKVADWAKPYVAAAASVGLIGFLGSSIDGARQATRAEAAVILYSLVQAAE